MSDVEEAWDAYQQRRGYGRKNPPHPLYAAGFYDALYDEGGLPIHLPMGVDAEGRGPENDSEAHHWVCWCPDVNCMWTRYFKEAAKAGARLALREASESHD